MEAIEVCCVLNKSQHVQPYYTYTYSITWNCARYVLKFDDTVWDIHMYVLR